MQIRMNCTIIHPMAYRIRSVLYLIQRWLFGICIFKDGGWLLATTKGLYRYSNGTCWNLLENESITSLFVDNRGGCGSVHYPMVLRYFCEGEWVSFGRMIPLTRLSITRSVLSIRISKGTSGSVPMPVLQS